MSANSKFTGIFLSLFATLVILVGCGGDDDAEGDPQPSDTTHVESDQIQPQTDADQTNTSDQDSNDAGTSDSVAENGATANADVLALIADNHNIAIVVNPSKILDSDLFATILEAVVPEGTPNPIDALAGQIGFDVRSVQRLYGFAEVKAPAGLAPGGGGGPFGNNLRSANDSATQPVYYQPGFGPPGLGGGPAFDPSALIPTDMIFYGVADQDIAALQFITATLPAEKKFDVNGKTCFLLGDNDEFALHLPTTKSVLAGPVESLKQALAGDGGQSDFAKAFAKLDLSSDLTVRALSPPQPETPNPGAGGLNPLAGLSSVTASTIKVNLDKDEIIQVQMEAADEAALTQVNQSLTGVLGLGKAIIGGQVAQMANNPNLPAEQVEGLKFAQQLLNTIGIAKQEDSVSLTLTLSEDLRDQLIGMIKMGAGSAKQSAQGALTLNHMKQIALGLHIYNAEEGELPVGESEKIKYADGKQLLSWRVHILPFIEEQELYAQFHLDEPWDSEHNITLLEQMPEVYSSPTLELKPGHTAFVAPAADGAVLLGDAKISFGDIGDGSSLTAVFVEAGAEQAIPWTKPGGVEINPEDVAASLGIDGDIAVALADGAVLRIPADFDNQSWLNLLNANDGNAVELP